MQHSVPSTHDILQKHMLSTLQTKFERGLNTADGRADVHLRIILQFTAGAESLCVSLCERAQVFWVE